MKKQIWSILLAVLLLWCVLPMCTLTARAGEQKSPYSVKMKATPGTGTLDVGDTVMVEITVSSGNSTVKNYSAYDLTLHYDTKILAFESALLSDSNAEIMEENGVIRVRGYGTDKALTTTAATVIFKVLKEGEGKITLTQAQIDLSDNAGLRNAPSAGIPQKPITVKAIRTVSVTLKGDGLTADSLEASSGKDYSFKAKDAQLYEYVITVMAGGVDITDKMVFTAKTGAGKIPKKYITGDLVISAVRKPKEFTVTIQGKDTVGAKKAVYLTDYQFVVTPEKGYTYTVAVTVGGKSYKDTAENKNVYTIPGEDITGNIKITVTKKEDKTVEEKKGSASLSSSGSKNKTTDSSKSSAQTQEADPEDLEVYEYLVLDKTTLYLVICPGSENSGPMPVYDGNNMYWSDQYQGFVWLVGSDKEPEEAKEEICKKIARSSKGKIAGYVNYSGNVNLSLNKDIADVQLVRDMYMSRYTLATMEMLKFLNADLNGDKKIDICDIVAAAYLMKEEKE